MIDRVGLSCDKCNLIRSRSSFIHKNGHWSYNHKNWLFGFLCCHHSIVSLQWDLLCGDETFLLKRMITGKHLIMTMIDMFVNASVFKHSIQSCHLYLWLMSCKKTGLVAFSSQINKQMITQQLSSRDHPSFCQDVIHSNIFNTDSFNWSAICFSCLVWMHLASEYFSPTSCDYLMRYVW